MTADINRRDFVFSSVVVAGGLAPWPLGLAADASELDEAAAKNPALLKRVQRLEALAAVTNQMGRYFVLHADQQFETALQLFALSTPGVKVELLGWGAWEGADAVRKVIVGWPNYTRDLHDAAMRKAFPGENVPSGAGQMSLHSLATPLIEVADDAKTVKATWESPGFETAFDNQNTLQAYWAFTRIAADFINENGNWKIWHLRVTPIFRTPFHQSWVQTSMQGPVAIPSLPPAIAPSRPVAPVHRYSVKQAPVLDPPLPEPYSSFGKTFSY